MPVSLEMNGKRRDLEMVRAQGRPQGKNPRSGASAQPGPRATPHASAFSGVARTVAASGNARNP
jgi:hypothetical protein